MRHLLRPRSRAFRSLLVLALLAWTALPFDALAYPFAMNGGMAAHAASSHCDGMPQSPHASRHAPSHPAGNGHGCCANGACNCASLCNGIAGVPNLDVSMQPLRDPSSRPVRAAPAPAYSSPPLRPPIA